MQKSPGHQKWPDHTVNEESLDDELRVEVDGVVVAESRDVIRVEEDDHPPRFYFPRSDVHMDALDPSGKDTECPFKGTGRYFDVKANGNVVANAAWSYEDAYEEHRDLENRIAFHAREMDNIELVGAH